MIMSERGSLPSLNDICRELQNGKSRFDVLRYALGRGFSFPLIASGIFLCTSSQYTDVSERDVSMEVGTDLTSLREDGMLLPEVYGVVFEGPNAPIPVEFIS